MLKRLRVECSVDPVASMQAIDNPTLASIATEVRTRLKTTMKSL